MNQEFSFRDVLVSVHGQIQSNNDPSLVRARMAAYCESWNTNDLETRRSLFEETAIFCDPKNATAIEGIDSIYGFWEESKEMPGEINTTLHSTVACGDNGLLDFTIVFYNPDGSIVNLRVREVFTFGRSGKIKALEAYWDIGSIT